MKATTGVTTQDKTWYASRQPTTRKIQHIECILSEWLLDYFELQANYAFLLLGHAQNIRSLTYVFIATTTIFIMAAAYLQHTHSVYTEVEKRVNSQVINPKGYMHM